MSAPGSASDARPGVASKAGAEPSAEGSSGGEEAARDDDAMPARSLPPTGAEAAAGRASEVSAGGGPRAGVEASADVAAEVGAGVPAGMASEAPADSEGSGPAGPSRALEISLRVCGGFVAVVAAVTTALAEIFFAPLRVGGVLIGASVLVAVVANVALVRFTAAVAGARWAVVPALIWLTLMIAASFRREEGDILLANNWVGIGTIFAGSLAFAGAAAKLIIASAPPPPGRR